MKRAFITTVALLSVFGNVNAKADDTSSPRPLALTDRGFVQGINAAGEHQFLGIPYAAPPVGSLRWRAPQPAAPWSGLLDASQPGNACAQPGTPFGTASTAEDCLYLNVYAPATGLGSLLPHPVMVWIHGGSLQYGSGNFYDPKKLVDQGVVVVTINYRLGALGFLADPALTAESPEGTSGNYGLQDQQAALAWVRRNIGAFGGNPLDVTLFGESSGGLSVHANLVSPRAAGLFDRAIASSALYTSTQPTLAQAESAGTAFATTVGCTDNAACLRAVPVATLLANRGTAVTAYLPNVDGKILPLSIGDALASGQFHRVPVIEGSNHDEERLFVALGFDFTASGPATAANYTSNIGAFLGLSSSQAATVAARYPLSAYASPDLALATLATDATFACNTLAVEQSLSKYVPTFAYEFSDATAPEDFLPPATFPYGAAHASDLQYIFGLPLTPTPVPALTATQEALSSAMVDYWTQFASSGQPNALATPLWAPLSPLTGALEELAQSGPQASSTAAFASDHQCAFWTALKGQ